MTSSAATGAAPAFIEVGKGDARAASPCAPAPAARPGCSGWAASIRTCRAPRRSRSTHGRPSDDRACVRFDYSGHGESGGDFVDGTIGRWLEESVAVFEQFCSGPQVVIGSSMGGWMALLLARELARRQAARASLAGLVLIAPAPDFTEELMWKGFSPEVRQEIETKGVWLRPSQYGEPYPITHA